MFSTNHKPHITHHSLLNSPIAVGGTGGSGTRAAQEVMEKLGVFMGNNNSLTRDSQDFAPFLQANIPALLEQVQHIDYRLEDLPSPFVKNITAKLEAVASHALAQVPAGATQWGWKNPRSIFMLPFLLARYPGLRFVHVVRDGRDMAMSSNLNQMKLYYTLIFGRPIADPPYSSAIEMWNKINIEVRRWAEKHLGERYYILRFEDVCAAPEEAVKKLAAWLQWGGDVPPPQMRDALACITPPNTIARWRTLDADTQQQLQMLGSEALQLFGYNR